MLLAKRATLILCVALLFSQFLLTSFSNLPISRAADPTVKLEPEAGETGSPLTLRGSNYDPDKLIALEIIQPNKSDTYPTELVYRIGLVMTDGKGEFAWTGVVPASFVTIDYVNPDAPPTTNPFTSTITIEAVRYNFTPDREAGALLGYAFPEQKGRVSYNVTANNGKGPKLFNTFGSLDSETFLETLWNPLDLPVAVDRAEPKRGYIWGPRPVYAAYEAYTEGTQNGYRPVMYFDKSRMENTVVKQEAALTNGLLVVEMVSGRVQVGDSTFQETKPAETFVAGDFGNNVAPRYGQFQPLLSINENQDGMVINKQLKNDGKVEANPAFDSFGVTAGHQVAETKHFIANVFWDYLNQKGNLASLSGVPPRYSYRKNDLLFKPTFYATGYPITEPYWADVTLAGQTKQVLIQLFERRVLTYTPSNVDPYKVEMGNVGLQYFAWRYNR